MTIKEKEFYYYNGPIFHFGRKIGNMKVYTEAVSMAQAVNNLTAQAKRRCGFDYKTRVTIDASLVQKGEN